MNIGEAFKLTVFRFELKASDIAQNAGLDRAVISRFRGGTNIRVETLERILVALPDEARAYMLDQLKTIGVEDIGGSVKESSQSESAEGDEDTD